MSSPSITRVHVVEDDKSVRDGLCLLLRDHGYHPIPWADGASLLAHGEFASTDLIVLDIGLPGIDGVKVVDALRQRGYQNEIVVVSGLSSTSYNRAIDTIQPKNAFRKPIDIEGLLACLSAKPA